LGRTALLVIVVTTFQIDPRIGFLAFLAYLAFIWSHYKFDECSRDIADLKRRLKELEKHA
jgi:hypothetical protein